MKTFDDSTIKALEDERCGILRPDAEHEKKIRAAREQAALAGELQMAALAAMTALVQKNGPSESIAADAWAIAEQMVAERAKRIPDAFVTFGLSARIL